MKSVHRKNQYSMLCYFFIFGPGGGGGSCAVEEETVR